MRRSVLWIFALGAMSSIGASTARAASTTFIERQGDYACPEGLFEFRVDSPISGTYDITGTDHSVSVTTDGVFFDWSSTTGIAIVIAKGGPNANEYIYLPPAVSLGDTQLNAPIDPLVGAPFELTRISFCYDLDLEVTTTAATSFKRVWSWTISKIGDRTDLVLQPGQEVEVEYEIQVTPTALDSDWAVSGTIAIHNPAAVSATLASVFDVLSPDILASVDCGVTFPFELASRQDLTCTYSAALPDGTERIHQTMVFTSGPVGPGFAEVTVEFTEPSLEVDECVEVVDVPFAPLNDGLPVCRTAKTFTFPLTVGPYECGEHEHINVASFVTNDTDETGTDDHRLHIEVPCGNGCTLTRGYWKTHSDFGPAPFDPTWDALQNGADTDFFLSGESWHEVFWTPPAGNPYYILAHPYMAARLNALAGADTSDVADALAAAEGFLQMFPPSNWPLGMKSTILAWAKTLDMYNNGVTGPGSCSE